MRRISTNYTPKQVPKEINIKQLFRVIKDRLWIVITFTILATLIGIIYNSFFTTPLYQSSTRIIIDADAEYRNTLQVIIKDPTVLEKVIQELKIERSSEALAQQINVVSIDNSQVVSISVVDTDPVRASKIANATAKVFKDEVPNIIGFDKVSFLSDAKINPYPINENNTKHIFLALVVGLFAGIGLVFLIDSLDESIKTDYEVEEWLGLPVLGSVSKMNKRNVKKNQKRDLDIELRGETIGFK